MKDKAIIKKAMGTLQEFVRKQYSLKCTFWACNSRPENNRIESMITCSRCIAIIETNRHIRALEKLLPKSLNSPDMDEQLRLTAYNVKTKEKGCEIHDARISLTIKGALMVKGHDGKGNPLTSLVNAQKGLAAIDAGLAKADFDVDAFRQKQQGKTPPPPSDRPHGPGTDSE
jgi:hypothetical protein